MVAEPFGGLEARDAPDECLGHLTDEDHFEVGGRAMSASIAQLYAHFDLVDLLADLRVLLVIGETRSEE